MEITRRLAINWFSSEMLVAYQFCKVGYTLCVPLTPRPYDLLVDTGRQIVRVQVKRARFEGQRKRPQGLGDRDHWAVELDGRKTNGRSPKLHVAKDLDAYDYLAAVCLEDLIYVIPVSRLKSAEPGKMLRLIQIKPPVGTDGRDDSKMAGLRWEPFKNKFTLEESSE
jgi:hypothetical protein